ncbi:MAG TPA: BPSS1780 family membrane protein [Burkholderiaceae bacterium]|nr:BPSS1780 family membrane protein [Burkholderiaceae bacterium]
MVVRTVPARTGLTWLRDALALYRRQPFAFTSLVILYTMGVSLLVYIPFIGMPLAAVLIPFGTIGLTLAGREAERGVMPLPTLMVQPFRDMQQRKALTRLGLVHAGLVLLLVLLAWILAADELANWKMIDGQIDKTSAAQNFPWDAFVVAAIGYLPILMLTWFAPQLVAWHGQPIGKALFFSFFACWRNRWPFLTLGAALFALAFGVVFIVTQSLQAFGASPQLASLLFAPMLLVLISVGYATQYPIYRSLLEPPDGRALAHTDPPEKN